MRLKKTCLQMMLISRQLLTLVLEKLMKRRSKKQDSKIENTQILDNAQDMLDEDKDSDIFDDDDKHSDKRNHHLKSFIIN